MLRVGSVPYLVARPLDQGLAEEPGIRLEHAVPAELVARLRKGELDVALVSSIELFRRPDYAYLPGIAVAGRGAVSSVQIFLRKPLGEVRSVALDPASRTAASLARVLLAEGARELIEFREVGADEDPRAASCDAWLRIGDPALREFHAPDAPEVFNPSAAWVERTGLPFVFAPWIVRPGVEIDPYLAAFARARSAGARRLDELARRAARAWSLPASVCRAYLCEEIEYEPGEEMHAALCAFRDAAAPLGLCEARHQPRPIDSFLAHRA